MSFEVKFVRLRDGAQSPSRGSDFAAGYDLYACMDNSNEVTLWPGKTVKIGTGLSIQPPPGYFGAIFARSGLATKQGLRPSNCVGVCDEDYTGEYIVPLYNDSDHYHTVHNGDRIAQLVFLPYLNIEFNEVESLDETVRGADGFGSTGK